MELRTLDASHLEEMWRLDADAFHQSADKREYFLRFADPARFVGGFDEGRLVAMTAALPFGQFFGGRVVPMGGLSSVAVSPEQRRRGWATRLVRAALGEMSARGEVLSSLFPATTSLYRALGWELAGSHCWRRISPRSLGQLPASEGVRVRPYAEADAQPLRDCYARVARSINGCLDRPESWWQRRFDRWQECRVFVAEEEGGGEPVGYLAYRQLDGEYSALGGGFGLVVEDLVATTRDASLALWQLLASWASVADRVLWRGPAEDPLLLLLPQQEIQTIAEVRWMLRVVDAAGAVAARGFPIGVDAEIDLELADAELPNNAGRYRLQVRKGRGHLESGGAGSVGLDAGALASLYSGWASTSVLARAGRLAGGSAEERAALDAIFAGPATGLMDEF